MGKKEATSMIASSRYASLCKMDTRMLQAAVSGCFAGQLLLWRMPHRHGALCLCMIVLFLPEML